MQDAAQFASEATLADIPLPPPSHGGPKDIMLAADTTSTPTSTSDMDREPVVRLLQTTTAGQLLQDIMRDESVAPRHPICLDSELTVAEGCQALANNRISSAPVFSIEAGGFVGMLDFRDLVSYVLEVFHKVPKEEAQSMDESMEVTDIVRRAQLDRTGVPVGLVSNLSHRNPLVATWSDASLLDAVDEFGRSGVHRLVVLERAKEESAPPKFIGVLSQSSIAALVAKTYGRLARVNNKGAVTEDWPVGNMTLRELGLVRGNVISVTANDSVLEALYTMHTNGISSVAIRDGELRMCGSISMTDIKEILSTRGGWRRLFEPCFRFFASVRSMQGLQSGGNDRIPSFTIAPTATLVSAIEKMAATRTHRVWICNDEGELVGVVCLSDVMPLLLPAPKA